MFSRALDIARNKGVIKVAPQVRQAPQALTGEPPEHGQSFAASGEPAYDVSGSYDEKVAIERRAEENLNRISQLFNTEKREDLTSRSFLG